MSRPNFIPRTRIGAHGERLFDIPGVYYPREMLAPGDGGTSVNPKILDAPPRGYMSTDAAAKLLNVATRSGTRAILHKKRCPWCLVKQKKGSPLIYWRTKNVRAIADKNAPADSPPQGYVSTAEALSLVGCPRSVLQRGVEKGFVRAVTRRVPAPHRTGLMVRAFFCAADLPAFKERCAFHAAYRQACRQPPPHLPAP